METNVHLTPEPERFADECIEGGRDNDVSEVVRSGLRLLQEAEERRAAFRRCCERPSSKRTAMASSPLIR
jgi:antitoxin ParD1/3/4